MEFLKFEEKKLCRRCVLPEAGGNIFFNEQGICNICVEYDQQKAAEGPAPKLLETDLLKILNKYRGKGKYDCLAMCSGGKDSTSALYYMKKRYNMNPLAFMFDNGFEMEDAIQNVENAADKLGVDFLFFRTAHMKKMFAKVLETGSQTVLCHPCSIWYMDLAYETAARYEIPIIVAGWTKGQSTDQNIMSKCGCNINAPEFKSMGEATKHFVETYVKNDPQYKDFPSSMEEVMTRAKKRAKTLTLSPHWFLPVGPEEYVKVIQKDLDWKFPRMSYPGKSTNCSLNFISVFNSFKYYGYTHYHVEMSKLIRQGVISREDALKDLEFQISKEQLNMISAKLGHEIA